MFHVNAYQRVTSAEEAFNNHVTMTCSAYTSELFPQPPQSSPKELMNKVARVAEMEITYRLSNMDCHSQKQVSYGHCWAPNLLAAETNTESQNTALFPEVVSQPLGGRLITLDSLHHGRSSVLLSLLEERLILDAVLSFLHAMLLSKLPSANLGCALSSIIVFHAALFLIK